MPHTNTLDPNRTALLVVDIQEAFRNAIPDFALVASRTSIAVRGFQVLGMPVFVTEQYPAGLGRTAEEIRLVLPEDFEVFEKTTFSSYKAEGFAAALEDAGVGQVVLCGLETHVCVNQTAHDLLEQGVQVHLLTDAVCSRFEHDKYAGLAKMAGSGVISSSIEMAFFELMRDARHESFREIQALIK